MIRSTIRQVFVGLLAGTLIYQPMPQAATLAKNRLPESKPLETIEPSKQAPIEEPIEKDLPEFVEGNTEGSEAEATLGDDSHDSEPLYDTQDAPAAANFELMKGNVSGNALIYSTGRTVALLPGHAGITPEVSVQYADTAPIQSLGQGWNLSGDFYIEREWSRGALTFVPADYYRVQAPGGFKGDLLYLAGQSSGSNYVFISTQSGAAPSKYIYNSSSDTWSVVSPGGGPRLTFSKVVKNSCAGATHKDVTFRWYLTQTKDDYGNHVDYDWSVGTTCYTDGSLEFEPTLTSIRWALSDDGTHYYKAVFNYKGSQQLTGAESGDSSIAWQATKYGLTGGLQATQVANQKVQSIETFLCNNWNCSTSTRVGTTFFDYIDASPTDDTVIHLEKIYTCGKTDSAITTSDLSNRATCLKPTVYTYSNSVDTNNDGAGDTSTDIHRLVKTTYPTGGTEEMVYARLNSVRVGGSTNLPNSVVVAVRLISKDGTGQNYEAHFYCKDPFYNSDAPSFQGCKWVEARQVNVGSVYNFQGKNRLANGQSTLTKTYTGNPGESADGDSPLLKGFVVESYLFNDKIDGSAAWDKTDQAVQKTVNYPRFDVKFCHDDVTNTEKICEGTTGTDRYGFALTGIKATRTDVYNDNGISCSTDNCRQTVIQKNEYSENASDFLASDSLNLKEVSFRRCDGAVPDSLDIDSSDLGDYCPTATKVVFSYGQDPGDAYVRKITKTQVYPSLGGSYWQKVQYQTAPSGRWGNVTESYVGWTTLQSGVDAKTGASGGEITPQQINPVVRMGDAAFPVSAQNEYPVPDWASVVIEKLKTVLHDNFDRIIGDLQVQVYEEQVSANVYSSRGIATETTTCFTAGCADSLTTKITRFDSTLDLYPELSETTYTDRGTIAIENDYNVAQGLVSWTKVSSTGISPKTTFTYDTYGRLTQVKDDLTTGTYSKKIEYDDTHYRYVKTTTVTGGGELVSVDHYDGLGRVWAKLVGPYNNGSYIYSAQEFNDKGQVIHTYHPKTKTGDPTTPPTTTDAYSGTYTETTYNPLGQVEATDLDTPSGKIHSESKMVGPVAAVFGPDVFASGMAMATEGSQTPAYTGHGQTLYDGFGNPIEVRQFCDVKYCGSGFTDTLVSTWRTDDKDGFIDDPVNTWYAPTYLQEDGKYRGTYYEYDYRAKPDGSGVDALITRIVDVHGNETLFGYDDLGRRTKLIDPDAGKTSYEYDLSGHLTQQVDARGVVAKFTYQQGLAISATYTNEDSSESEQMVNTYGTGSFCSSTSYVHPNTLSESEVIINQDGAQQTMVTRYCYDQRGRVLERLYDMAFGGSLSSVDPVVGQKVQYTWTDDGQVKTLKAAGNTFTYTYCGSSSLGCTVGQLISISGYGTTTASYVTNATYDENGQMQSISYGNGCVTGYAYDPDTKRLLTITTHCTQGEIQDLGYSYRAGGNIWEITSTPTAQVWIDGDTKEDIASNASTTFYEYDGLDQLIYAKSTRNGDGSCIYEQKYSYDTIGNMRSKKELCNRDGEATKYSWEFNYDGGNDGPHQLSSVGVENYRIIGSHEIPEGCNSGNCTLAMEYDASGNTTVNYNPHNGWRREMSWTPRGQMEAVSYCEPSSSCNGLKFLYDHRNLRYLKYQPSSVKTDFNQPSWTVYLDKLVEFGVRDQNIELTGKAIQVDYANLHVFMGGIDPSTGEVAPGTRRIATIDNEDGSLSAGLALNATDKSSGCSSVISASSENSGTGLLELILMLFPIGFMFVIRRRRRYQS